MGKTVKKKGRGALVFLLVIVAFFICAIILPNTKGQKYKKAQEYLYDGLYTEASEIFSELGDYEDAPRLLLESRYEEANRLLRDQRYQQAMDAFQALGEYRDSAEKILDCYFGLGEDAYGQENYEEAVDYYLQAGQSEAVQSALDKAYYDWGHQLFVKGLYVAAEKKFACVQTMPEYAEPHFRYLEDAREYLHEQADKLEEEITCYISQRPIPPPGDSLWDMASNYVPFQSGTAFYDDDAKTLQITALYHAGVRILRAWQTDDYEDLNQDELQALEKAKELVAQAMEQSQDPLEIELYLYNWLCDNVAYESPDMEVDEETFMKLRQLSCVGALLDGKANCQGYTDAFYLLGNMAGFDVCKMSGTGDWEPHTWNGIMLDGKLYLVDVTFGDTGETREESKLYTWFNSPYDPETYTIDGGEETFPGLVLENDLSKSYYTARECVFTSMSDAAYYLLRRYKANGPSMDFAMIEGVELENEDFDRALENNLSRAGVYSCSVSWILHTYSGNTYLTVWWE